MVAASGIYVIFEPIHLEPRAQAPLDPFNLVFGSEAFQSFRLEGHSISLPIANISNSWIGSSEDIIWIWRHFT